MILQDSYGRFDVFKDGHVVTAFPRHRNGLQGRKSYTFLRDWGACDKPTAAHPVCVPLSHLAELRNPNQRGKTSFWKGNNQAFRGMPALPDLEESRCSVALRIPIFTCPAVGGTLTWQRLPQAFPANWGGSERHSSQWQSQRPLPSGNPRHNAYWRGSKRARQTAGPVALSHVTHGEVGEGCLPGASVAAGKILCKLPLSSVYLASSSSPSTPCQLWVEVKSHWAFPVSPLWQKEGPVLENPRVESQMPQGTVPTRMRPAPFCRQLGSQAGLISWLSWPAILCLAKNLSSLPGSPPPHPIGKTRSPSPSRPRMPILALGKAARGP